MKKLINSVLLSLCIVLLSGCYQDLEKTSLDEYILYINQNKFGYSNVEIDHPDYFLPNLTFIQDYNYIDGKFYWRDDDPLRGLFTTKVNPEISFLYLQYDESIYFNAKKFMLKEIEPYNNKYFVYNNYVFYENSNAIYLRNLSSSIPEFFTMACYNDEKYALLFIGLYSGTLAGPSCIEKKYVDDIDNNWGDFLKQYFGRCHNFNN